MYSADGSGVKVYIIDTGIEFGHVEIPGPGVGGYKGCGEGGAIGATPAVINAITDAIGNNKLEMPASPDRVWHAIHG